jgi:hypothetical protein
MRGKTTDLTGQTFLRLAVVRRDGSTAAGSARWLCECSCGTTLTVDGQHLRNGHTQSCGCYKVEQTVEQKTKHGYSRYRDQSPEYRAWQAAKNRCYRVKDARFQRYGARGIRMCDRWRDNFSNFIADIGPKPAPNLSLDRIDNNGNYEPGNCRWATTLQQAQNR